MAEAALWWPGGATSVAGGGRRDPAAAPTALGLVGDHLARPAVALQVQGA
ncbi:hypothetical protein ACIA98_23945 [Streptomyces sp. NPDC051366]